MSEARAPLKLVTKSWIYGSVSGRFMLLSSGIPEMTIHTEEPDEALSRIAPKSSVLKVWCHSIREGWDGTGLVTVQIHVPSGT
jgi:hypothetical protein